MNNNTNSDYTQTQYKRLKVSRDIASRITSHAVKNCCKTLKSVAVTLKVNAQGKAYYHGLFKCGSVWDCPHCSGIISSERREEIEKAIDSWRLSGGKVKLITYTVRHNLGHDLKSVMFALGEAYRFTKSGAPYQRVKELYNIKGSIVATEINYGEFGWHYHKHEIIFYKTNKDFVQLEAFIYKRYNSKLKELGFNSLVGIGVNVSAGEGQLSNYLSKWGLENELTSIKDSKSKTPFQLLDDPVDQDLFIEYSRTMHSKKRITWSKGMKDYFNINEVSDEELVEEENSPEDKIIKVISHSEWKYIIKNDLYLKVLMKAEKLGTNFNTWYDWEINNYLFT